MTGPTASSGDVDLARLLAEEPDSAAKEFQAYAVLRGPTQPLTSFVRELVIANDVARLDDLARSTTPLHTLLRRRVPPHVKVADDLASPYANRDPAPVNALRALALFGLALVDDEKSAEEHLSAGANWLHIARTCVPSDVVTRPPTTLPVSAHPQRIAHLASLLRRDGHPATALIWLLELDDAHTKRTTGPTIPVLLDGGDKGRMAYLRLSTIKHLPACLVPDPRTMSWFTADENFQRSLANAWAQHATRINGTVLWSLDDADGPVHRVIDKSLGGAFAVLQDELRRTSRPIAKLVTIRRLRSGTAVVGGIDTNGKLESATGYATKLGADAAVKRVVVPAADKEAAEEHAKGGDIEIVPADDYKAAARRCRKRDRRATLRLTAVALVIALLGGAGSAYLITRLRQSASEQQRIAEEQHRIVEAKRLMEEAAAVRDDNPQLALKLGLAAQKIHANAETNTSLANTLIAADLSRTLAGHDSRVTDVAFTPDGRGLATVDDIGTVILWQAGDSPRQLSRTPSDGTGLLEFGDNGRLLALGSGDGVILWNVADPAHPRELGTGTAEDTAEAYAASALAFSPDSKTLVSATEGGVLTLWDVTNPAHPRQLGKGATKSTDEAGAVTELVFTPNGKTLVSASDDGTVTLWTIANPTKPRPITSTTAGDLGTIHTVALNREGNILAIAASAEQASPSTLTLWDISTPQSPNELSEQIALNDAVSAMAFSPGGEVLAIAVGSGTVTLWDSADPTYPRPLIQLDGHEDHVNALRFIPTGETLASVGDAGTVIVWNAAYLPHHITLPQTDVVVAGAVAPTGHILAAGSVDQAQDNSVLTLWDITNPRKPNRLGPPMSNRTDFVNAVTSSADGTAMAGVTTHLEEDADSVIVVDTSDPKNPHKIGQPLTALTGHVIETAFSANGNILAISTYSDSQKKGELSLWDTTNPANPTLLARHPGGYFPIELNADGTMLATTTDGPAKDTYSVTLFDISDPGNMRQLSQPTTRRNNLNGITFDTTGQLLATSNGTNVTLWNLANPRQPQQLGHTNNSGDITAIAFNSESQILATADEEGSVLLWDISNPNSPRQLGLPFGSHGTPIYDVTFSLDGNMLTTVNQDHDIIMWGLTQLNNILRHTTDLACQNASGGFTENEWLRYVKHDYEPTCTN